MVGQGGQHGVVPGGVRCGAVTTAAQTRWPHRSSGSPKTATSSTPATSDRAASTSAG